MHHEAIQSMECNKNETTNQLFHIQGYFEGKWRT